MTGVREVLVLQHVPWEKPGLIADALAPVSPIVRNVVSLREPELPAPSELAGLVVMGGPQGALDDDRWPGLAAERSLLARAAQAGVPVLGVCLGMQLLAVALGAALHSSHGTEIGYGPVHRNARDPVLDPLGAEPTVLHWHSDAVELPVGAELLASSAATPVQAFRAGSALGLQFHIEVDAALLSAWLGDRRMTEGVPAEALRRIRADAPAAARLEPAATSALGVFATAVRDRRGDL